MNPVLHKDVLQTFRLKRVAAIQILFIVVLGLGVLACWPQQGFLSIADSTQDDLLFTLIVGQLILLHLFIPGGAAVAISGEREANTVELLCASRLSMNRILIGKIGGVVAFPLLLIATSLPFVGLLAYRGVTNVEQVLMSYVLLVVTALFLSIISLVVSACCRDVSTAIIASYTATFILCVVPLVPAAILLDTSSGLPAGLLHYSRSLSPMAAALTLLRPSLGDFDGRIHHFQSLFPVFFCGASVVSAMGILFVRFRLSRIEIEFEKPQREPSIATLSRRRRLMFFSGSAGRHRVIGALNPLFVNESRINPLRSGRWGIRIFYASLVTSMALALISLYAGTGDPGLLNYVVLVIVAFNVGVIALISPALTSPSISSEIETGTFELLRMTPLRPSQFFVGKLVPSLISAVLPILALVPAYAAVCYLDPGYIPYFARLLPVLLCADIFCCTVGFACSSWIANSARAAVVSVAICAVVFFVPPFLELVGHRRLTASDISRLSVPSPLSAAMHLIDRTIGASAMPNLWSMHLYAMSIAIALLLVVTWARLSALLRSN